MRRAEPSLRVKLAEESYCVLFSNRLVSFCELLTAAVVA